MFLSEIPNVDMLLDNMSSYVFMVFHTEYHLSDIYIRVKDGSIFITEMSRLMAMNIFYAIP